MGFNVSDSGDLLDPTRQRVLKHNIMQEELCKWFKANGVDFNDDHFKWTKKDMITKLCTVMGTERHQGLQSMFDPDDSYVLTIDNVTKILAIQMRFRYSGTACISLVPNSCPPSLPSENILR